MEIIVAIVAVISIALFVVIYDGQNSKKRINRYLEKSYGNLRENADERRERIDLAARYYISESEDIADQYKVDDITWNDLGMDDVFIEASQTDCYAGEQYLYSAMRRLDVSEQELSENDKRAGYFDKNEEKRNTVRRILYSIGQSASGFTLSEDIHNIGKKRLKFSKCLIIAAVLPILLLISGVLLKIKLFLFLAILSLTANMIIHTFLKNEVERSMQTIFNAVGIINSAKKISSEVPEFSADISDELEKLSSVLNRSAYAVACRNAELTDNKVMVLLFWVLNCFMTDLILYDMIIDEFESKADNFMKIYRYIGRMDYVIAVASYRRYIGDYCIPEFTDEKTMKFNGLYHPLIKNAVSNDLFYNKNMIITGSNASGKSTFIKAVAIDLILGQTLHTCFAENAVIPRCGVMTSMALTDDILSGESYYIREIRYLKRMVELCGEGRLLFLAVDEILRGTNTRERIAASKAVLEYFGDKKCMVMVATHDMELAEYFRESCENCHFCETVTEGNVMFDYKLHEGMSTTSNAIRLLGAMGFPDEIVENAEKYSI